MGILADFVIADAGAGEAILQSGNKEEQWPTLPCSDLMTHHIAALYCAITGAPDDEEVEASFTEACDDESEGPWVSEFPAEVLNAIAGLAPAQVQAVAEAW